MMGIQEWKHEMQRITEHESLALAAARIGDWHVVIREHGWLQGYRDALSAVAVVEIESVEECKPALALLDRMRCAACRAADHADYSVEKVLCTVRDPATGTVLWHDYLCLEHQDMYQANGYEVEPEH